MPIATDQNTTPVWTEGVCGDGAVILRDGVPVSISDVLAALNTGAAPDLLEAARLLEEAETRHANCEECEGEGVPELCPVCFPFFDDARVKRRLAIAKVEQSK